MRMMQNFSYAFDFCGMCMLLTWKKMNTENIKIMADMWRWQVPRLKF
jgi:hypothetical protein